MSTTNWSSQAGMGDGDSGDVTSGSTTIDTNWTQSSGMTDVSDAEEANIVELVERAETAATNAETAETNAETAETNAETAETGAETAKTGAETAKTAAEAAQTASEAAQTAAETAESNAETAYANTLAIYGDTTDVQDAVDSASTSATNAATSATSASTSATSASTSASAAATSATAAATSATSSASSASTSNTSALAAQTAEANAETAEANAITARLAAESAESNAEGSATQAANSATSASSSASQALSSKNAAAASESASATSAYNAGVSESNASTSEDNAAISAGQAAIAAQSALLNAGNASSSATDAETAQTAAESAQASAEAVYDSFDDRYLGSKSSDPTLDNDGDALLTGALYFNSTENEMRVYTGSAWEPVQELSGDQTVNSLTSNNDVVVKGNLEVQGTTITVDSATAQTIDLGDNDKIRLGDGDDLQIYHDGSNSIISDTGTGNLEVRANKFLVTNAGGTENIIFGRPNGAVSLYYDNAEKLATTSTGVDVTGNITVSGTVDGRDIAADGTTLDAVASTYVDVSGDTLTGDLAFGDNVKATFGASDDLQIYHDGSHSYIKEVGTGNLRFDADNWYVRSADGSEAKIAAITNGAVSLYYDGTVKLATTSSGVDITGTVVADGLTVEGTDTTTSIDSTGRLLTFFGASNNHIIRSDATDSNLQLRANDFVSINKAGTTTPYFKVDNQSGDISFYDDAGTSQDLYWDASTSRLGLGTTSPTYTLDIENSNVGGEVILASLNNSSSVAGSGAALTMQSFGKDYAKLAGHRDSFTGGSLRFYTRDSDVITEAMRIDSNGRLGIGTTSPEEPLTVQSGLYTGTVRIGADVNAGTLTDATQKLARINAPHYTNAEEDMFVIGTSCSSNANILYLGGSSGNHNAATSIQFYTAANHTTTSGTEAARIDSSGNLLVGTTDSSPENNSSGTSADDGIALMNAGYISACNYGAASLFLNRTSTDGTIAEFRKDGSTVGSIGSRSGVVSQIVLDPRSGSFQGAGIAGSGEAITPMDHSQQADAHTSLGNSSYRWKDLYLSGGVYLGGTGSANLLDDYEEGTWTPSLLGSTSGSIASFNTSQASYVKVGDLVQIGLYLNSINVSTSTISGNILIGGLPFNGDSFSGVANITYCNLFNFVESDVSITGYFNGTSIQLIKGSSTTSITDSDESSGVTGGALMMTLVYQI